MSFLKEEVDLGEEDIETEEVDFETEEEVDIETEEIDIETVDVSSEDVTRNEIYHVAIDVDQNPPQPDEIEAIDVETGDVAENIGREKSITGLESKDTLSNVGRVQI